MFWDEISNGGAATSPVQGLCSILRRPMSAIVTIIVGGSGSMLPQKIWNLEPLKLLKMLPILSVIDKKVHSFLIFLPFVFTFCTKYRHVTV